MANKNQKFCIIMITITTALIIYGIIVSVTWWQINASEFDFIWRLTTYDIYDGYGLYQIYHDINRCVVSLIIYCLYLIPLVLLIVSYIKKARICIYIATGFIAGLTFFNFVYNSSAYSTPLQILLLIGHLIGTVARIMMLVYSICNIFVKPSYKSYSDTELNKLNQMFETNILSQNEYSKKRLAIKEQFEKELAVGIKTGQCNKCKTKIEFYEDQSTIKCDKCGTRYNNPYYKDK